MRILIAPDKFKGSLDARAVAAEIAAGLRDVLPAAELILQPMADGGEGTAEVICAAANGQWHTCPARDANGTPVSARYALLDRGTTAVLETSEANGLWRIPPAARAPLRASSFGVGEMLRAVAAAGAERIIAGLGGSATNDGGYGLARALGFRFLDSDGAELAGGVAELCGLARIVAPEALRLPPITIAADVRNPLLGAQGATRVFAAQKGAAPEQIERLEEVLAKLADTVARDLGIEARDVPGAGAAGGLGFGLLVFARAEMRPGFELVAERVGLEAAMRAADVVVTGEGRLDAQTLAGKVPAGVAAMARQNGKPCYAIAGELEENAAVRAAFDGVLVLGGTMTEGRELLRERARELAERLLARRKWDF